MHTPSPLDLPHPQVFRTHMTQTPHWPEGFSPPGSAGGWRGRAGGDRPTLTSNLQPDFCRGGAQLVDGSAGVDASIPLLSHRDPKRPRAGVLRGQDHLETLWTKEENASGTAWSPWEAGVKPLLIPGSCHAQAGAWGRGGRFPQKSGNRVSVLPEEKSSGDRGEGGCTMVYNGGSVPNATELHLNMVKMVNFFCLLPQFNLLKSAPLSQSPEPLC